MFVNYFKIAIRNLFKTKSFTLINVTGLAIGISSCILILLFIQDELSYDKFHQKHDRIVRVVEERKNSDGSFSLVPLSSGIIGEIALGRVSNVDNYVSILSRSVTGRFTVKYGDNKFYSGDHIFTSPSFFNIFDFKLLEGDKRLCLAEPNSVVLTQKAALKYFGKDGDPLGKLLFVERIGDCKVTGVMQDIPQNSHLTFDLIFSIETLLKNDSWRKWFNSWKSDQVTSYILMKPETDIAGVNELLNKISRDHFTEASINTRDIRLQRLDDIHFYSADMEFDYLNSNPGDISYIYILSIVAVFILLIACINFINLSIAGSINRAKEVGLRKVMGAFRRNLFTQFLGESLIISFISLFFSILIIELLSPLFNSLTGKNISINFIHNWPFILALIVFTINVGIISGSYPALYLSKFQPLNVLKGFTKSNKGYSLKKVLVVIQFTLSITMIISTFIVYNQLEYIRTKKLGFIKDNTLVVDINSAETRNNFASVKTEMLKYPSVKNVTVSSRVPGDWKNLTEVDVITTSSPIISKAYFITIDEDFIDSYSLALVSGRNFFSGMGADSNSIIINETAAGLFRWNDPLGKQIKVPGEDYEGTIIGVVKDFHFQSLYEKVSPLVLGYLNNPVESIDYFSIKVNNADISLVLKQLQTVHEKFDKITPFEFNFLDERINTFYTNDQRMGKLFSIAAVLSAFISCLGLFALSSYMIQLRTKEIGIRKVLGASVPVILSLLSKDFIKLIIIACLIAFPVSFFAMNEWLKDFAYRTDVSFITFFISGMTAVVIACITILYQAVKASLANPVNSIKYE